MSEKYTIEKAAYLLGVEPEKIYGMIHDHLVKTIEEDGQSFITKQEVARLYDGINKNGTEELPEEVEAELHHPSSTDEIVITDEKLLQTFAEMKTCQERIRNLAGKIKRLSIRVNRLQAIGSGETARFWERASALYPNLWAEGMMLLEERSDKLILRRQNQNEGDDYKKRLRGIIIEGMQKGHLPQGFLGFFPPPGDSKEKNKGEEE